MPVYVDPDEPDFVRLEARHRWVVGVLVADYGELSDTVIGDTPPATDIEAPEVLNWLLLVPPSRRFDFSDIECGLVYVSPDSDYACTVWDATGEEDDPWAVVLVDDFGPRLLQEYSLFDPDTAEDERDAVLSRASNEIPERCERGEFDRGGVPQPIPEWLERAADSVLVEDEE